MNVEVELDVPAVMRDGTTLLADVYRPAGEGGPWPTLLIRTPYGKGDLTETAWNGLSPVEAARRGFMVVIQDVRGRFASQGDWLPLAHEREDGADSVAWASALPGSNGRVGMCGGSYCGHTQLAVALEAPPALGAIAPLMTWSEPLDGLLARGGAVELGLDLVWSLIAGLDWLGRTAPPEELAARAAALLEDIDRVDDDGYWQLPVSDSALLRRHRVPALDGMRVARDPEIAERGRVAGSYEQVTVPALHTGGWHDLFVQGTLDNYCAMVEQGREARLIVGPWAHEQFADPIGERAFGVMARRDAPSHPHGSWNDEQLAFLGRHLGAAGSTEAAAGVPPVRIFVMGRNGWRDEDAWPLERAVEATWHLRADALLTLDAPADGERSDTYIYDPADPVPTHGGAFLASPGWPCGPVDQARIEARDDVLTFTSAVLEHDLEVTGRVRAVLHVQSSAPSTDWVVRLCDVGPDGRSFNVCDGIVRVPAGAEGSGRVEVDLWSTSNVFLAGHRLRVQVTSSCFPRWDRNLGTGRQDEARMVSAQQRVFHDAARASAIVLPVVAS